MTFLVRLKHDVDPDFAWRYFESLGCVVHFATEEKGHHEMIIEAKSSIPKDLVHSFVPYKLAEINYATEWERHAPCFKEGKAHVHLQNGSSIELIPGAGFGDLSHPTTGLILELMAKHVQNQRVVDIGSGSGILSLAAKKLGAKEVFGIDIEINAVFHARENARINQLDKKVNFFFQRNSGP